MEVRRFEQSRKGKSVVMVGQPDIQKLSKNGFVLPLDFTRP